MSFRIERLVGEEDIVVLRVSGRLRAKHVDMIRDLLSQEKGTVILDCKEVTLIDREVVSFLALIETNGVELTNCAAYIREWVSRERSRNEDDRSDPKAGAGDDIGDI